MDQERGSGDGEEGNTASSVQQQQASAGHQSQSAAGNRLANWKLDEALLQELITMGIDRNTAKKAAYYTSVESGASNVEKCIDWVFSNPNPIELSKTTIEEDLGLEQICQMSPELNLNYDLHTTEDYKMVFVLNTSLNMSLGKSCAQTAHAALAILNEITRDKFINGYRNWCMTGETKIVLIGNSTAHLEELKRKADELGLANETIQDAGRTEIPSGSKTVLVIFGANSLVDKVTGTLRLLK